MAFFIGIIMLTTGYSSYLSFYPFKTLEVNSATIKVKEIKAGDLLTYTVDYCKYTDKPATVYRTLHSIDESQTIPFPSVSTISQPGCHVTDVPLQTFPSIKSGMYYLLVDVDFAINSQRDIHVKFITNNFEIR